MNENKEEMLKDQEVKTDENEQGTAVEDAPVTADKEKEDLQRLANDYKDKWMRNVAEFDNYKKRNAKLWQDAFIEGEFNVLGKILTIGDNLDRALTMGLDAKTQEGIKNVKRQFDETLKGLGVEEINPIGEKFDPTVAEAVFSAEAEEGEDSDTVKQVFEKGYMLNGKIIRYAKVSVIK